MLLSVPISAARAASSQQTSSQPTVGPVLVIDLLPESSNRATAVTDLTAQVGGPVSLVPPDPVMLELLRWTAADPARSTCTDRIKELQTSGVLARPEAHATPDALPFEQLLILAESQLSDLQLDDALKSLDMARSLLPCSDAVTSRDAVRTLFLLEAVVHLYKKDGKHRDSVIDTLGVDSSLYLGQKYPPKVQAAFLDTARELIEQLPLDVVTQEPGEQGATSAERSTSTLYVDGQPAATFKTIRPGRHILQLRGPSGQIRTTMVPISRASGPRIDLSTLATFGLPSRAETRGTLTRRLLQQQLDAAQVDALRQYLSRSGQSRAAFVLQGSTTALELRMFDAATGQVTVPDSSAWPRAVAQPTPKASSASQRIAIQLSLGGGVGLVSPDTPASPGGVLRAGVGYRLTPQISLEGFGKLRREGSSGSGGYSSWTAGVVAGYRLRLGERWSLMPAIGYAYDSGQAAALTCEVIWIGDHEEYVCDGTGDATVWTRVPAHGPVARLDLGWHTGPDTGPWSFHVGIDAQLGLIDLLSEGTADVSGPNPAILRFSALNADVSSGRLEVLAGITRIF